MDSEYAPAIGAAILGAVSGGAHNSPMMQLML